MKQKFDFAVGGQALIEGVMMRSPHYIAVAVRKQDGSIKIHDWPFQTLVQRWKFLNVPIIRGAINMIEMMVVGMKAMNLSADEAIEIEEEITEKKQHDELIDSHKTDFWNKLFSGLAFGLSVFMSLFLALLLFKVVPLYITEFLRDDLNLLQSSDIAYNALDGSIKLIVFVLYIAGISLFPSIGRVFQYHGAEHKAIWAYENDEDLQKVEGARQQTRFHPRCGTSFIFIVIIISIIFYTFIPRNPVFWIQVGQRVLVLPIIAGLSYEALKLSAKYQNNSLIKLLIKPGLWFQKLTTREPDDSQLEVALESLNRTLELEKNHQ